MSEPEPHQRGAYAFAGLVSRNEQPDLIDPRGCSFGGVNTTVIVFWPSLLGRRRTAKKH